MMHLMNEIILSLALLQVALPLALIAANTLVPSSARLGLILRTAALLALLYYLSLTGLWLFAPWWTPYALMGLAVLGALWRLGRTKGGGRVRLRWIENGLAVGVLILAGILIWPAYAGRTLPANAIDLAMPLGPGRYLVTSGGTTEAINAHLIPLPSARAAEFRGQSYAVDIIGIDRLGRRAKGISPVDPKAYVIYGTPVLAPCDGTIVQVIDGVSDMPVPQMDRANMTGNSVVLECEGLFVLLAHLAPKSITVQEGAIVGASALVGMVGNTGNSGEPHLHIHVQKGSPPDAPLSGDPVWFTLDGVFYIRNDRFTVTD